MWSALGWSAIWQDELLTGVERNHNRLPALTDWQTLAEAFLLRLAWRFAHVRMELELGSVVLQNFQKKCSEIICRWIQWICFFLPLSVSVLPLLWLSRWRDCTDFAQRGADTMASIVPFERAEGRVEGGAGGENYSYCRETREMLFYIFAQLLCVCVCPCGLLCATTINCQSPGDPPTPLLLGQNSSGFRFCFSDSCRRRRKANRSPVSHSCVLRLFFTVLEKHRLSVIVFIDCLICVRVKKHVPRQSNKELRCWVCWYIYGRFFFVFFSALWSLAGHWNSLVCMHVHMHACVWWALLTERHLPLDYTQLLSE